MQEEQEKEAAEEKENKDEFSEEDTKAGKEI